MNHYTYRAEWSPEDDKYLGRCVEMPELLPAIAPTAPEAIAAIEQIVAEDIGSLEDSGAQAPTSLAERPYSGKFLVRTSTALHKRLSIEAADEGVSLNQWVVQQLSGRKPRQPWDDF
ncbi:MAG: type II toxin-antitoxin system HicB family antitoxin [Mycobacteriaceae bacterium]|nr:type II toxin-antitoxin system HicB family antitoxin [Mycobacteriaceae bacterium]